MNNRMLLDFILGDINTKLNEDKNVIVDFELGEYKFRSFYELINNAAKMICKLDSDIVAIDMKNDIYFLSIILAIWKSDKTAFILPCFLDELEKNQIIKENSIYYTVSLTRSDRKTNSSRFMIINQYQSNLNKKKVKENILDNIAIIIPTSGTEGKYKYISIDTISALNSIETVIKNYDLPLEFMELIILPLSSASALFTQALTCLSLNIPIATMSSHYDPRSIFKMLKNYNVSLLASTPTIFRILLTSKKLIAFLNKIPYIYLGGEIVPNVLLDRIHELLPLPCIKILYGLTETIIPISGDLRSSIPPFSIGIPYKEFKISINPIKNIDIGGEIIIESFEIKTSNYFGLYNENNMVNSEEPNKIYTGDLGYLDKDGNLYITGRIKNIAIINGVNVSLEEVKNLLLSHKDVEDCYVYYENDSVNGNKILANVISSNQILTQSDIQQYLFSITNSYKIPKKIIISSNVRLKGLGKIGRTKDE